jgi:hypothetical protein
MISMIDRIGVVCKPIECPELVVELGHRMSYHLAVHLIFIDVHEILQGRYLYGRATCKHSTSFPFRRPAAAAHVLMCAWEIAMGEVKL